MSKEQEEKKIEEKSQGKKPEKQEKRQVSHIGEESVVRIMSTDIPGSKKIFVGLTKIKGVSWSFSNALCKFLKIDKNRKISSLNKEEIEKISAFLRNPNIPKYLLNRRKDYDTGEDKHLLGSDLDLQREFDIKRLKKIRSYRGWRHAFGQPTRGQRTKSHFRTRGKKKAVGVMNKPKTGGKT